MVDPDGNSAVFAGIRAFWRLATAGAIVISRPASGVLLSHSLHSTESLSINEGNQKKFGNIINQIKGSDEYGNLVRGYLQEAESTGQNTVIKTSKSLQFSTKGDLGTSIGKAAIPSFTAERSSDGIWTTNTTMTDRYNYEPSKYPGSLLNKAFGVLNNMALVTEKLGIIRQYDETIKFSDKIKSSK